MHTTNEHIIAWDGIAMLAQHIMTWLLSVYVFSVPNNPEAPWAQGPALFHFVSPVFLAKGLGQSGMLIEVVPLPMKWPLAAVAALTMAAAGVCKLIIGISFTTEALPSNHFSTHLAQEFPGIAAR